VERWFYLDDMEIYGIDSIQSVKTTALQEAVHAPHIEDTVIISTEAQKRAEWVDILKQMPDVRHENMAAALSRATCSPSEIALHMIQTGF
jgi:hypothetical protein